MQITIVGDLFHWTITEYTATDSRYYAVDANTFELVASEIIPDPERPLAQRLERILLPLRLRFTSWRTQLISSLRRLFELPSAVRVYPGHGDATTIGAEKRF